jgi:peptidoglycan/LPS O-acetylase OafA/YrhL
MSPFSGNTLHHRKDIDGLRAVAVLLVVFCHLGWHPFAGGYIGVDVFFVISGYLISGILLRQIDAGTFTFASFYERRVRRIAPALLATLLVTTFLARQYLLPPDLRDYAITQLAALGSVSNFFFLGTWKYFDPENQARPLLHTWSLAVEEQYYLFFPLFLVAIQRWWPRARKLIVWTLATTIFLAVCVQMANSHAQYSFAFFFSPLRIWEFLIGTMIYDVPPTFSAWKRNALAAAGLLLIVVPAFIYQPLTAFPGLAALPPCLGAALILYTGQTGPSLVANVLSWSPIRFIGLISYSLYLVHWPIMSFQTASEFLVDAEHHRLWVKPAVFATSLVAATLSWRFIEQPFREGRLRPGRRALYTITGSACAGMLLISLVLVRSYGWRLSPLPVTATAIQYAAYHIDYPHSQPGHCFSVDGSAYDPSCLSTDPARRNWLLYGDSHSEVIYEALHKTFPDVNISEASMTGCRPIAESSLWVPENCNQFNTMLFHDYVLHHHVDRVLLLCRWRYYMLDDLGRTIAFLNAHGVQTVVIGPSIEFDTTMPRLMFIASRRHNPEVYSNHLSPEAQQLDAHMAWLARTSWKTEYISMFEDLCHPAPNPQDPPWQIRTWTGCPIFANPLTPILSDDNHLTAEGSLFFAAAIKARLQLSDR